MTTKYDEQIARLTAHPELIESEWLLAVGLFQMIDNVFPGNKGKGCPTSIRESYGRGPLYPCMAFIGGKYHEQLTKRIAEDEGIPASYKDITPEHLQAFLVLRLEIDRLEEEAQKETT